MDAIMPEAAVSVVKVLQRLGHDVEFLDQAVCCAQPAFNSGYWEESRALARVTLKHLPSSGPIVIPSGSCGAMLKKFYGELFAGHSEEAEVKDLSGRVHEFSSFLVNELKVEDLGASYKGRATFHDGCHGLRELRCFDEPRRLLAKVAGLELVEMKDRETCCGFGGAFAVKYSAISAAMGEVKCQSIEESQAQLVISNDSSCLMHLQGILQRDKKSVKLMHLAEVLAHRES